MLKDNLEELQKKAKERTVKTQTIEYDLETIVKKIKRDVIKLNPDYQRNYRWSNEFSSRLIESLILNIPIPFIYISQDIDVDDDTEDDISRYSVIDGQQRLTAIYSFFNNSYPLEKLDVLSQLNGCFYKDLPPFLIRRLEERSIRCLRIDSTADNQVKYDIFERLNSGSVKLEPQELRNATCRGPFRDLIKKLSKNKNFINLINFKEDSARSVKMEDQELVLRYFALTYNDGYKNYKGDFKKFLTQRMISLNELSTVDFSNMEKNFLDTMKFLIESGVEYPFSKYKHENDKGSFTRISKFNAAVFDAICFLAINFMESGRKIDINTIESLFSDTSFYDACDVSTSHVKKVNIRINKVLEL
ncbi:DUF262 domain-containing protein [Veronia pacifica]|uniref:GmrSD restriction endonucleases N-terminal domain-containing protein n=1 Tax=Veronia pacifica TaxID=1080227 RepID=A0A1C3EE28_9GAMM|nr:DUF262 domain-containing protein [Veronia pacifica]ODA31501.1 hypothetical protein A8L45_16515 [Veronia pacifica]